MKQVINYAQLNEENKKQLLEFLFQSQLAAKQKVSRISLQQQKKSKINNLQLSGNKSKSHNASKERISVIPRNGGYVKHQQEKKAILANKQTVLKPRKSVEDSLKNVTPIKKGPLQDHKTMSLSEFEARTDKSERGSERRNRSKSDRPAKSPQPLPNKKVGNPSRAKYQHLNSKQNRDSLPPRLPRINLHKVTEDQKNTNTVFFSCLKHMNISLGGVRPIRWSAPQLHNAIEQIFSQLFSKNQQLLYLSQKGSCQHRVLTNSTHSNSTQLSIKSMITSFYTNKFKNIKLATFNLINLLFSLSSFMNRTVPSYYNCHLVIFEKILTEQYSPQEVLFFLYSRSTMQKVFHVSFNALWDKSSKDYLKDSLFIVNQCKMVLFLKDILEGQVDLVYKYKHTIFKDCSSQEIHCYEVLQILLEDFTEKQNSGYDNQLFETIQAKDRPNKTQPNQPCNKKQKDFYREISFKETRFEARLEESQSYQNSEATFENNFWDCKEISQIKIEDDLEVIILRKLQLKVQKLIDIVCNENSPKQRQIIYEITYRKAVNMLHSLFQMNKYLWFKELQLQHPESKDLKQIEALQLSLRRIVEQNRKGGEISNQAKAISELCKTVLTVDILTEELETMIGTVGIAS